MVSKMWIIIALTAILVQYCTATKPNIVFILADDLGFYDVGFNGASEVKTPNIDRIAGEGVILDNYYVQPICTPTRSAFLTGKYPIHNGMQSGVVKPGCRAGLPLADKLIPEYLKPLGYKSHIIGKWHLGMYAENYLPQHRGFDSYYGYYSGSADYYTHRRRYDGYFGLDLHDNETADTSQKGVYSNDLLTSKTVSVIQDHATNQPNDPLFLYVPYQAVHTPLEAPQAYLDLFPGVSDGSRKTLLAMLANLDDGVQQIYDELVKQDMMNNTVFIFSSDNGGAGKDDLSSNYPLRGEKNTLFEGGIRSSTVVYSPLLTNPGRRTSALMHVTDWLPTFVNLAGGNVADLTDIDGFNVWDSIDDDNTSPRTELLHNIENDKVALRVGNYKLIGGQVRASNDWYEPSSSGGNYDSLSVNCGVKPSNTPSCTRRMCLFNIATDPCEYVDLSRTEATKYNELIAKLNVYKANVVASVNSNLFDALADPALHNGAWDPWVIL